MHYAKQLTRSKIQKFSGLRHRNLHLFSCEKCVNIDSHLVANTISILYFENNEYLLLMNNIKTNKVSFLM